MWIRLQLIDMAVFGNELMGKPTWLLQFSFLSLWNFGFFAYPASNDVLFLHVRKKLSCWSFSVGSLRYHLVYFYLFLWYGITMAFGFFCFFVIIGAFCVCVFVSSVSLISFFPAPIGSS